MAMSNKQSVTTWLESALSRAALEADFKAAGFVRPRGTLTYERQLPELKQTIVVVFDLIAHDDPAAVSAHLLPQVVLESPRLTEIVREMTAGDANLIGLGDGSLVLRDQFQNLAHKGEHREKGSRWFARREGDAPALVADIAKFAKAWVLPFLDRYRDFDSLMRGYEADDERLRAGRRFYLYVTAMYVHAGRVEDALAVLTHWFGRPALRKQYARAFDYVESLRRI
jgi:hypothetical protein